MDAPKRTLETLELVGGILCLDFANTINSRRNPVHEYLSAYADLVDWAEKVGMLSETEVNRLKLKSKHEVGEDEKVLQKAHLLRGLIHRVFSAIANQSEPGKEDLSSIIRFYKDTLSHSYLLETENHYKISWKLDEILDAPLLPIAHSAAKLLLSKELRHIKECPGCGWLFLDTSKNQSRRWCSMNTCGARDKMRRYHGRLKKK